MKTENKIVKLFIEEKKSKTIREIAKEINSDYRITHVATQRLLGKNVLLSKNVGRSILCELNPFYYGIEIYEAEDERRKELLRNSDIKQLFKEVMLKIKSSFFIFLVFGSHVKGKLTKFSDIDIMLISNETEIEEKIYNVLSLLPVKTHLFVFTEEEFCRMKDSKKLNVIQETVKSNVILYGIENYYRLK